MGENLKIAWAEFSTLSWATLLHGRTLAAASTSLKLGPGVLT